MSTIRFVLITCAILFAYSVLPAQIVPFSTYDWTNITGPEGWADVKSPGGHVELGSSPDTRRVYSVGSAFLANTTQNIPASQFSNADTEPATGCPAW